MVDFQSLEPVHALFPTNSFLEVVAFQVLTPFEALLILLLEAIITVPNTTFLTAGGRVDHRFWHRFSIYFGNRLGNDDLLLDSRGTVRVLALAILLNLLVNRVQILLKLVDRSDAASAVNLIHKIALRRGKKTWAGCELVGSRNLCVTLLEVPHEVACSQERRRDDEDDSPGRGRAMCFDLDHRAQVQFEQAVGKEVHSERDGVR